MLLTPRIVRTQELTVENVSPIFIGSQQSLGLGGPPPLIAPTVTDTDVPDAVPAPAPEATQPVPAQPVPPAGSGDVGVPPGSSQIPGTTTLPGAAPQPAAPAGDVPAGAVPVTATGGQIILSPPGPEFLVGAGPYTVPVSITNASQVSSLSLTITFNPAVLRVRSVQEGSFMRAGGVAATFTQQVDAAAGRIDIAIVRPADPTGVAGTGLLSAILFDAVGGGPANMTVTGTAIGPRGAPVPLEFGPAPGVTVR